MCVFVCMCVCDSLSLSLSLSLSFLLLLLRCEHDPAEIVGKVNTCIEKTSVKLTEVSLPPNTHIPLTKNKLRRNYPSSFIFHVECFTGEIYISKEGTHMLLTHLCPCRPSQSPPPRNPPHCSQMGYSMADIKGIGITNQVRALSDYNNKLLFFISVIAMMRQKTQPRTLELNLEPNPYTP